jgi:hypothetical protein
MNLALKPEAAPSFPLHDLSEHNRGVLELMLSNSEIVTQGHLYAEKTSWSYRVGHPLIRDITDSLFIDPKHKRAIDHGIRSFETIAWLTSSIREHHGTFAVEKCAKTFRHALTGEELLDSVALAHEHFTEELPHTTQAIIESSDRFCPALSHYAIAGAALMRQFELNTAQ